MPELRMLWRDMSLFHFQTARRIAAVTIDATEDDMRGLVHRLDAFVTLEATGALSVCLGLSLINPVAFRQRSGTSDRLVRGNGSRWTVGTNGICPVSEYG